MKYVEANDSVKHQNYSEALQREKIQYIFKLSEQKLAEMANKARLKTYLNYFLSVVLLLIGIVGYFLWQSIKRKNETQIARERLLRLAEEDKNKQGEKQIKKNIEQIELLKKQLSEAQQQNDQSVVKRLQQDTELLTKENQIIEILHNRSEQLLSELYRNELYVRIRLNAGKDNFHLTEEEWAELGRLLDRTYNNFTVRLLKLVDVSDLELKVCYLQKIGIQVGAISTMLYKSKSAISMLRQRLYKKITGKKGSTAEFDAFFKNF